MKGIPCGFIKFIHQGDQLGVVQALITEQLADSGIVLLFDMGGVVFLPGSSREKGPG